MIELDKYLLYSILETIALLLVWVIFLLSRVKKYKPYYLANKEPLDFLRKHIDFTLHVTREHARSLNHDADQGEAKAIIMRRHLVARLNWLVLERDFLTVEEPDEMYWHDMDHRIDRLLSNWEMVGFIEERPDDKNIKQTLSDTPHLAKNSESDFLPDLPEAVEKDSQATLAKIDYLERKLAEMAGFQDMYLGLKNTFDNLSNSYRQLKHDIADINLEAEQAKILRGILKQHEINERTLSQEMQEIEKGKDRLRDELGQLEGAYNKLEQEHIELQHELEEISAEDLDEDMGEHNELVHRALDNDGLSEEDIMALKEVMEQQNLLISSFKSEINSLNVGKYVQKKLETFATEIFRKNAEIQTCMTMLDMERERLAIELETVKDLNEDIDDSSTADDDSDFSTGVDDDDDDSEIRRT
ncbi:MAG: hypothetical protein OEY38_18635 [Gammaproteobacteria bacterium]|nr:hypothetical protein [Gammaproteobacteria bacterium]